jgi:hypothetical protein
MLLSVSNIVAINSFEKSNTLKTVSLNVTSAPSVTLHKIGLPSELVDVNLTLLAIIFLMPPSIVIPVIGLC